MPPFSTKFISDSELADIYAYLASIKTPAPVKSIPLLNDLPRARTPFQKYAPREQIPEIRELDLNPIFGLPPGEGCSVVDDRIRVRDYRAKGLCT
jgi:hypothetical protein